MKRVILLLAFFYSMALGQGWNNTVTTSIYDFNFLEMDLLSNKNGNNLAELTWNADLPSIYYVKYYLLNSSGSIIRSSTTTTQVNYVDNDVVIGNGSSGDALYKIRAKDVSNHLSGYTNTISFDFQSLQKQTYNSANVIEEFGISQNFHNPFNPTTKISYSIPEDAKVMLKVYDMLGTEVAELVNETQTSGYYETTFDASNLSSGVYIYRITALREDRILFTQSKQMILIK